MNAFDLHASFEGFELAAAATWDAPSTVLFGASGAGKSTILEAIAGLRPDVKGEVTLRDRRVDALPSRRRRVGWVPQDAALFPHLTARENVAFAAKRGDVAPDLAFLEIDPVLDRPATQLSGGERQRVAIARALAAGAEFLLLDEPLASVDRPLRSRIVHFLRRVPRETGVPMLIVTHDPLEAVMLAQQAIVIESGRVVSVGDPRGVFASAAALGSLLALGAENRFEVTVVGRAPGCLRVKTLGGCELELAHPSGFPDPVCVAVRAEDVVLAGERPLRVSARNVLSAMVESVEPCGEQSYVRLRSAGDLWVAKVTHRGWESVGAGAGGTVHLILKAHSIQPVPPDPPSSAASTGKLP